MKRDRCTNRFLIPLGLALLGCVIFATGAAEAAQRKVLMENFEADW